MKRPVNRLTVLQVQALKDPGLHADGGGLYLQVDPNGSRRWVAIWNKDGKRHQMALGVFPNVGLAIARLRTRELKSLIRAGRDPIAERKAAAQTG